MGDNLRSRGFDFIDWCIMCHCCRGECGSFVVTLWKDLSVIEFCL